MSYSLRRSRLVALKYALHLPATLKVSSRAPLLGGRGSRPSLGNADLSRDYARRIEAVGRRRLESAQSRRNTTHAAALIGQVVGSIPEFLSAPNEINEDFHFRLSSITSIVSTSACDGRIALHSDDTTGSATSIDASHSVVFSRAVPFRCLPKLATQDAARNITLSRCNSTCGR
jgi:hypothetical protein